MVCSVYYIECKVINKWFKGFLILLLASMKKLVTKGDGF